MSTTVSARTATETGRATVDVTEASTREVQAFAADVDGPLHLERRGGRTYLVAHESR
ncbi:MAG: hypothetical protein ABEJ79_10395 [Halolamina sp.]